jgi:hypothetical protein
VLEQLLEQQAKGGGLAAAAAAAASERELRGAADDDGLGRQPAAQAPPTIESLLRAKCMEVAELRVLTELAEREGREPPHASREPVPLR